MQKKVQNKKEFSKEEVKDLCEYVYYGMSIKEAFVLSGKGNLNALSHILADSGLMRALTYAKLKAKLEHMQAAQRLALMDKPTIVSFQMLKHLLSSRFGLCESNKELAQKDRQHKDLMQHRRETLRQWADYQSAKMIQDASGHQLAEYQQLESKS